MSLEDDVREFMYKCNDYKEQEVVDFPQTLMFTKDDPEGTKRWGFHIEKDEQAFKDINISSYIKRLSGIKDKLKLTTFDTIVTELITKLDNFKYLKDNYEKPDNGIYSGTINDFLNRFIKKLIGVQKNFIADQLKRHTTLWNGVNGKQNKELYTIEQDFEGKDIEGKSGVDFLINLLKKGSEANIFTVQGDAGTGKSIFALILTQKLLRNFGSKSSNAVPFLLLYTGKTPKIDNMITLNLEDFKMSGILNLKSVEFLIRKGKINLILDGFDEINIALHPIMYEANVKQLRNSINPKTSGKVVLTSRISFIEQEQFYKSLIKECGQEGKAKIFTLKRFSDEQIKEWVLENENNRVWSQLTSLFKVNPDIKEVCRTPVFLKLVSEISSQLENIKSKYELVKTWCNRIYKRERPKRIVLQKVTDEQLNKVYEVIAEEYWHKTFQIDYNEVKVFIEIIFNEQKDVLNKIDSNPDQFIKEVSIGPLTGATIKSVFSFRHEIFASYFYARRLVYFLEDYIVNNNSLTKFRENWGEFIELSIWEFLPLALKDILKLNGKRKEIFEKAKLPINTAQGLLNLLRAFELVSDYKDLFKGREFIRFNNKNIISDMTDYDFSDSIFINAVFSGINLQKATFRNITIGKLKFENCKLEGAIFDNLKYQPDCSIAINGQEIRAKEEIERKIKSISFPVNLAREAILKVFGILWHGLPKDTNDLKNEIIDLYSPAKDWLINLPEQLHRSGWLAEIREGFLGINEAHKKKIENLIVKTIPGKGHIDWSRTEYQTLTDIEKDYIQRYSLKDRF